MSDKKPSARDELFFSDITEFVEDAARRARAGNDEKPPERYRVALGRETLQLGIVEFRILVFLASRPYHPFTRRRIAEAVNSERHPVAEEAIDQHVASLRSQLSIFRDYVQAVPHVGYRFKA